MKVGDSRRALVAATTKGGGRLLTWTWGGVGWGVRLLRGGWVERGQGQEQVRQL